MAKKKPSKSGRQAKEPRLIESVLGQVEELYGKCEKRFMEALEDSERQTIVLSFTCTLDKSNSAPVVDTVLRFKDKCKESGLEVTKTFKAGTSEELEDPNQEKLPGIDPKESGKMAAAGAQSED